MGNNICLGQIAGSLATGRIFKYRRHPGETIAGVHSTSGYFPSSSRRMSVAASRRCHLERRPALTRPERNIYPRAATTWRHPPSRWIAPNFDELWKNKFLYLISWKKHFFRIFSFYQRARSRSVEKKKKKKTLAKERNNFRRSRGFHHFYGSFLWHANTSV